MEIRVLKYFLEVAQKQNITKAAESLHLTQPTLSRQLTALEDKLGVALFDKSSRKITLTEEGLLLKRRAQEIIELEEKTFNELRLKDDSVGGSICIGAGEYKSFGVLASVCSKFRAKYPRVKIHVHTATADILAERMEKGLIDIGLFLEPVNTENYEYVRLNEKEKWCVFMKKDSPLASKRRIEKSDLLDKPLILPERVNIQSELANWFGKDFKKLDVAYISNLSVNASILAHHNDAYFVSIEGVTGFFMPQDMISIPLYPELSLPSIIAWNRDAPCTTVVTKFIEMIKCL